MNLKVNLPSNKVGIPQVVQEEAHEDDTPLYNNQKSIELNIIKDKKVKYEKSVESSLSLGSRVSSDLDKTNRINSAGL